MDPLNNFASHDNDDGELSFVDEHAITIACSSRELVWTALQRYVATSFSTRECCGRSLDAEQS